MKMIKGWASAVVAASCLAYAGTASASEGLLVRYDTSGNRVSSFGNNGVVKVPPPSGYAGMWTTSATSFGGKTFVAAILIRNDAVLQAGVITVNSTTGAVLSVQPVNFTDNALEVAITSNAAGDKAIIAASVNAITWEFFLGSTSDGVTINGGTQNFGPDNNIGRIQSISTCPSSDKIVIGGYWFGSSKGMVARFNPNRTRDTSFGTDGWLASNFANRNPSAIYDLECLSDDGIIAAGSNDSPGQFNLEKFTSSGAMDSSFDGNGVLDTTFSTTSERATTVYSTSNGYFAAGWGDSSSGRQGLAAKYLTSGGLDSGFSADGKDTISFSTGLEIYSATFGNANTLVGIANNHDAVIMQVTAGGAFRTAFSGDGWDTYTSPSGSVTRFTDVRWFPVNSTTLAVGYCNGTC